MTGAVKRHGLVYGLLAFLYLLHTDVWFWDDPRMLLGAPVGFTYHVLWSLAVAAAFALAVRFAWPKELEAATGPVDDAAPDAGDSAP